MMNKEKLTIPKRGEIWKVEFPKNKENRKPVRPCLVISNDIQNEYGKWMIVIPFTTKGTENVEPFEVLVKKTRETGIDHDSKLKVNYPRIVDKERLKERLGMINRELIKKFKEAWKIALDIEDW